ncbi:hypothetical protein RIF29_31239 [Crotalaria pallida]|uniref:Uncharacterized protein n=1 Tax=Crotalaria pallida TaxID=3830 RepID=A0AAN9EH01_CROPI
MWAVGRVCFRIFFFFIFHLYITYIFGEYLYYFLFLSLIILVLVEEKDVKLVPHPLVNDRIITSINVDSENG